jgi:serine/threonine protein kinase
MKILNELIDSADIEETEILKFVNTSMCPYIIKYYDAFTERYRCFIITELCDVNMFHTLLNFLINI